MVRFGILVFIKSISVGTIMYVVFSLTFLSLSRCGRCEHELPVERGGQHDDAILEKTFDRLEIEWQSLALFFVQSHTDLARLSVKRFGGVFNSFEVFVDIGDTNSFSFEIRLLIFRINVLTLTEWRRWPQSEMNRSQNQILRWWHLMALNTGSLRQSVEFYQTLRMLDKTKIARTDFEAVRNARQLSIYSIW